MSTSADPAASTTMSSIAARRHHTSLPSFQLPLTTHRVFNPLGPVLTPPAVSNHESGNTMVSSLNHSSSNYSSASYWPTSTQTSSSFSYSSAPVSSSSYTASSSNIGQSTSAGYRNLYSPGNHSVNRGNSRPTSPTTSMATSQSYEAPAHYGSSVGLPSISQNGLSQQYGNFPVNNASSQPAQASSDLYSTHSPLPPLSQSHTYYPQSSFGGSPTTSSLLSLSSAQPHSSFSRSLMSSTSGGSSTYPPLAPSHTGPRGYLGGHMSGLPMPYNMIVHPGMPQQERPFKCDQCPQSFNRNHDLKRHKRIHLAVKPFPCDCCEKSFSRKDALKRHRLVKGCGKGDKTTSRASESPTTSRRPVSPNTPTGDAHLPRHFSRSPTGNMMDRQ